MKVFKDLEVRVPLAARDEFLARLEESLPDGWTRDRDAERQAAGVGTELFRYFVCRKQGSRQSALVALFSKDEENLFVSNIVPRELQELSCDEYNRILDDFHDICRPVAEGMGLEVTRTEAEQTLEDWISESSAKKLRLFSAAANKSTGTSHPCDQQRWYDFVISVVQDPEPLDASRLVQWLIEEAGWPEGVAYDIGVEFEREVGLLKYFRTH